MRLDFITDGIAIDKHFQQCIYKKPVSLMFEQNSGRKNTHL